MNWARVLSFICSRLPDGPRAAFGRLIVWAAGRYKLANIPTSNEITKDNTQEVADKIRAALDGIGQGGKRGGWRAAKAVLDEARKPGEMLTTLPEDLMITVFMGLSGTTTPHTSFLAKQLLHSLKQKYYETGHADYLFSQAVDAVAKELRAADSWGGCIGSGTLQAIFEARLEPSPPLGSRARELVVLTVFQQTEDYKKFLTVDDDGSVSLPRGDSYEEFAASMLTNAYGVYPF